MQDRPHGQKPRITDGDGDSVNQFTGIGSFGQEMLVHQNGVVQISPEMPLDRAALIGCGVTTGVGAVFEAQRLSQGQPLLWLVVAEAVFLQFKELI